MLLLSGANRTCSSPVRCLCQAGGEICSDAVGLRLASGMSCRVSSTRHHQMSLVRCAEDDLGPHAAISLPGVVLGSGSAMETAVDSVTLSITSVGGECGRTTKQSMGRVLGRAPMDFGAVKLVISAPRRRTGAQRC